MIGLPTTTQPPAEPHSVELANPFTAVITPEVVQQILLKQVERAQAGDSRAAALVLKIALASSGKNQAPRRNPETPVQKLPSVALIASQLKCDAMTADQIAARLGGEPQQIRRVLENSDRFALGMGGRWSLAPGARPEN